MSRAPRLGAYGLCVDGLTEAALWMQAQPAGAPTLRLDVSAGKTTDAASRYDAGSADLRLLTGGGLRARRDAGAVDYILPAIPPDADLLHPYLAPAAALVWRWAGGEAVHAGVFAGNGGAVLVIGEKEAGKSTTLAWLTEAGVVVLADDLAIIDGKDVLAGPRSIDLRPPSGRPPGSTQVRTGGRRRVTLPPAPDRLPIAGIALLERVERVEVRPVPVGERWAPVAAQRCFPALATTPVVAARHRGRARRPRHPPAGS